MPTQSQSRRVERPRRCVRLLERQAAPEMRRRATVSVGRVHAGVGAYQVAGSHAVRLAAFGSVLRNGFAHRMSNPTWGSRRHQFRRARRPLLPMRRKSAHALGRRAQRRIRGDGSPVEHLTSSVVSVTLPVTTHELERVIRGRAPFRLGGAGDRPARRNPGKSGRHWAHAVRSRSSNHNSR
jgi:hypothetical protein